MEFWRPIGAARMSPGKRKGAAARFKALIKETARLSRQVIDGDGLTPGQRLLSTWQCGRLADTYADYHGHKRYRAALDFFLSDLYGPTDFSQRDRDISRVYPVMVKTLSEKAIDSLAKALELHALSMALDQKLLAVLEERLGVDPKGDIAQITPAIYAEAYRICDNHDDRVKQIELATSAGNILQEAVKSRLLYASVKVARKPAQLAGFGELQSFLERGLHAFKAMKGSHEFLDALHDRERFILEKLYAGAPIEEWLGPATHHLVPPPSK